MKNKVKILDKRSVKISDESTFGNNVVLHENVILNGKCEIGDNVEIFANTVISDSKIGSGTRILSSFIEKSELGHDNVIGPFTRIRPGTKTGDFVKLGNFVEVKNSSIDDHSKAAHLAYIGDADIGKRVNIGCGVIFVNYDGKTKHRTSVGDDAFIGSNCNLVAPLCVAPKTYVCAGTTLTVSTQPEDFVIGRARESVKEKRAGKYLDRE